MEEDIKKGKIRFFIISFIFIYPNIFNMLGFIMLLFTYKGYKRVKYIVIAFHFIVGLIYMAFIFITEMGIATRIVCVIYGVAILAAVRILARSESIAAFLEYQKTQRIHNKNSDNSRSK